MDRESGATATDHRSRTHVLLIALPRHSWAWLVLFGLRSVDQRQGLLCLIAAVETQVYGPYPRALRLGPRAVSIGSVDSLGVILYGKAVFIEAPALR